MFCIILLLYQIVSEREKRNGNKERKSARCSSVIESRSDSSKGRYGNFQQAMVCTSSLLIYPILLSDIVCAGQDTVSLRVQLIAATFVACGIATILQTTLGIRYSPSLLSLILPGCPSSMVRPSLSSLLYSSTNLVPNVLTASRIMWILPYGKPDSTR